jgi:hypothetical protein
MQQERVISSVDRQMEWMARQIDGEVGRQAGRQADRKTERRTDRSCLARLPVLPAVAIENEVNIGGGHDLRCTNRQAEFTSQLTKP